MRLLLGTDAPREVDEADLAALYPWPELPPDGRWIRAMMLQTLDGSTVGADGRSKSISTPADMQVFRQTRRGADAVLIGAQTMRAERYKPLQGSPRLVIVSRSLDLPWEEPVWRESAHLPLIITGAGVTGTALERARECAEVEVLATTTAESIIEVMERHGLHRITCEGGPHLLSELVRANLVDELDVAIAPIMAGGGQIRTGEARLPVHFALAHVLEADGYLFTRCLRQDFVQPTITG